ncbi:MAG: carbohydrate ABC transporter substrate-binding protein [Hyphomicrobiales bacterium]|jgi:multiple sugar transport system substrate-binding protein|nr:carbohydrate ABC transporter substrate-binding protein [Hyphomicrobiales bacterium]MBV9908316.1 carbohydrate ABC transporter substrate-binding protein [Hyphomicrobiales bacterium]
MRVHVYEQLMAMQRSRRDVLKGAAGAAALAASSSVLSSTPSFAEDSVVSQIMKIPGAGNGSPTDADWQKVGALCLGPTKANVKPGEFAGVEFSFMGLNNQNLHNFLFRGFLTPWEAYTGAKIKWIDLAQGDYNARLQQSIATGTVDFDIIEMGAPFEGDMGVKDLLSEMPDWVKTQVDFDDYVNYLKPPVGSWNGKIHRVTIDSDCHTINFRTDVFSDPDLAKQWKDSGGQGDWGQPKTWQQVQAVTKFLKGKKFKGKDVYGFLDQPKPWGGFGFYFLASRATAYAKYPGEKNWLFDENFKPLINSPAFVRAIQDVVDALPSEPPDQLNADGNTTAFQQFLPGTGSLLEWWGDIGTMARTSDISTIADVLDFDILPASDDVYNFRKGQWEKLPTGPNVAPNMAYLGWGIYVMKTVDSDEKRHKAAWSAAAHLGGKDLSMWTAAYPSGFQPYRKSHTNLDLWALAGYDKHYIGRYMYSQSTSYDHPNSAIEPRIPGIFQYYSIAEDELSKVYAGKETAQQGADNVAAAWEKLTDKLGRENQVKYYRIAMGLT